MIYRKTFKLSRDKRIAFGPTILGTIAYSTNRFTLVSHIIQCE